MVRVTNQVKSVQGGWQNNDMWSNYPKHLMEAKRDLEMTYFEPLPMAEVKERNRPRRKSDFYTKFAKKKYPTIGQELNNNLM